MRDIESFRGDDLAKRALYISYNQKEYTILSEHVKLIEQSIRIVFFELEQLENTGTVFNNRGHSLTSTTLTFLSLESFMAELFKVIACFKEIDLKKIKDKNIYQKICCFCDEINYDRKIFMKSDIYNKLQEFNDFRNALFHANFIGKKISIRKTIFAPFPVFANIADAIQALDICITVISIFRRIFNGIDLMPPMYMVNHEKNASLYLSIDQIYEEIILKSYYEILAKHNLTTQFQKSCRNFSYLPLAKLPIISILKVGQDDTFRHEFNNTKTSIFVDNYQKFVINNSEGLETGSLRRPKSMY